MPQLHHSPESPARSSVILARPTQQNQSSPNSTDTSSISQTPIWPLFPYRYYIPSSSERPQWLQFTGPRPKDYGPIAKELLLSLCNEMIKWLRAQQPASEVNGWHREQDSAVDGRGVSHSIFIDIRPTQILGHQLSVQLALDAMEALKSLVGYYGALSGGFEIWESAFLRGRSEVYIVEWPPVRAVEVR